MLRRACRFPGPFVAAGLMGMLGCSPSGEEPPLTLHEFDCGRLVYESPEAVGFGVRDDETAVRELLVPCYVVDHPDGLLLWDGGLSSDQVDRPFSGQLEALGLSLDSFDYVAFSHMHYDHVGVANEIGSGTLLIQREEFEAAFAEEIEVPGFDPELYEGLIRLDRQLLDGDHDVFGDGRVRILSLPGHTPGHQALFVDLETEGPVVLSGDLYHFRLSREKRIVPVFNVDSLATLQSMDRLEAFLVEEGATLWIEHDLERRLGRGQQSEFHD
jgi:N-acyl homoserine lactone hydrolase